MNGGSHNLHQTLFSFIFLTLQKKLNFLHLHICGNAHEILKATFPEILRIGKFTFTHVLYLTYELTICHVYGHKLTNNYMIITNILFKVNIIAEPFMRMQRIS